MILFYPCSNHLLAQRHKKQNKDHSNIQIIHRQNTIVISDTGNNYFPATTNETNSSESKKQHYKIALLLPLFLNEVQEPEDSAYTEVSSKSIQGLDLYQGIRFAFDSLAHSTGIHFQLQVLDTRNDDETVRMACLRPEFYEADLIIGPVYNNNLKIAAAYAKKYEIPMVSPLSPAENLTSDNKYFFMANPGLTMHCKN